ncbi:MAG: hypothetical protein AABZ60_21610 [Planctomycetota bacterium]
MIQILVILILGLGIPGGLLLWDLSCWKWIELGAEAWLASIVIKAVLGIAISAFSHRFLSTERSMACLWGSWSALCELGVSIYVLKTQIQPRLQDAIGFGVGAGALETLLLGVIHFYGILRKTSENKPNTSQDFFVIWGMVFERVSYLGGYVGARGLVWLSLQYWFFIPTLLVAFLSFGSIDGISSYAQVKGWNWSDPTICRKFYGFHISVVLIQILIFALSCGALYFLGKI